MLKRMWLTLLSTKRICETRPQRSFWSGEGQHCLLKVLYFGIGIKCIVGLEVVLREIQLMAQSPGLKYYQFSWEGLLWDKQPFDFFFFFSWNTHPLASFAVHFTYVALLWCCFPMFSRASAAQVTEKTAHTLYHTLSKQSKKKTHKTTKLWFLTVLKTSWTAPASDTLMENCGNMLWLESAIQILAGTSLWVAAVADKLWNPEVKAVCSGEPLPSSDPQQSARPCVPLYRCASPVCQQQACAFLGGSSLLLGSFGKPWERFAVFYRLVSFHAPH